jgi:hypothetical protein
MPENYKYGGGVSATLLHPVVAILMVLAIVCVLVLPRKYVSLPILWMVMLVPVGQQIYVGGVHLFALRLVVLFGLMRMCFSKMGGHGQSIPGGMNGIDRAFLLCILAQAISVMLTFHVGQAIINQVSFIWDWIGGYLLVRWTVQDEQDMYRLLRYLAILVVPIAAVMIIEHVKMFNLFSVLGGVTASPAMRDGKIRATGVFEHPIIAGSVGASMVPLFLMLWKNGKSRGLALVGLISATTIMWAANSSTCLVAYIAAVFAVLCWPLRKIMRKIRWGIAIALIALDLVMKAPVWFLIARVDLTGGSSSYHRAELVDQFIRHFWDWCFIGVANSSSWGLDMWDVQNQYVNVGETGGLLALICFIILLSRSFGSIGRARKMIEGDTNRQWMLWFLGSALFANLVAFFGVNYFDQSRMLWFLLLAMISTATAPLLQANIVPETVRPVFTRPTLAYQSGEFSGSTSQTKLQTPRTR